MHRFAPKVPWTALYERSGLKSVSDRVRRQPLVRRAERSLDGLRKTVVDAARQRTPQVTAAANWAVRQMLAQGATETTSIINASNILAPRSLTVPLADAASAAMADTAARAVERDAVHVAIAAVKQFTGAEAAAVFNTPLSALVATLAGLASGRAVVTARHQIGTIYDFALPEIAVGANARLAEAGAVNRLLEVEWLDALRSTDAAIGLQLLGTGFCIAGDTNYPSEAALIELARSCHKPAVAVCELAAIPGYPDLLPPTLPVISELVGRYDLVLFPGDRLLGGPGCGIVAGRRECIDQINQHPLAQAAHAGGIQRAGLTRTIELLSQPESSASVPLVQLAAASLDNLRERATRIAARLESNRAFAEITMHEQPCYLVEGRPESLPGWCISFTTPGQPIDDLTRRLRLAPTAIWCESDASTNRVTLHLRSIRPRHDESLVAALLAEDGR